MSVLRENRQFPKLREILSEDVLLGAQALLGAILVRGDLRARIVETEAYREEDDPACHAYRGKTPRNEVMYGDPGIAYVYFNYGVHWMLNVCAHEPGRAAAVLIRAAEPLSGLEIMLGRRSLGEGVRRFKAEDLLSGPGKLTQAFDIVSADNGLDLLDPRSSLHLLPPDEPVEILASTRVGIAEGKGHDLPWRFLDKTRLRWTSKPKPVPPNPPQ